MEDWTYLTGLNSCSVNRKMCMLRALKSGKFSPEETGECRAILLACFSVRERSLSISDGQEIEEQRLGT